VNLRPTVALLPLPIAFAAGSIAARTLYARVPLRFRADSGQPLAVVTAWGAHGEAAFAILAATVAAGAAATLVAMHRCARTATGSEGTAILATAALTAAAALTWPFVFSSDAYAYAAYGAMAAAGIDPYAPVAFATHGAFVDAARAQWSGSFPVCVYGPAFVAVATEVVRAGAGNVAATLFGFRALAVAAFLTSIALLDRALADTPPADRYRALCAYGLNPVCLWTAAEGHNDAFLMAAVMAAAAVARRNLPGGAFLMGLGALIKAPAAVLALGAGLHPQLGRARLRALTAAGAGVGVAAGLSLPVLLPALRTVGAHGVYDPQVSVQGLFGPRIGVLLACAAAAWGLVLFERGRAAGAAWLGIALMVALPNGYPWYAPWLLPWCLGAGWGAASRALWAATIFSVARYLPDAAGTLGADAVRAAAAVAALPLAFALAELRLRIPTRKKVSVRS